MVVTRRIRGVVQGEHQGLFPGPGTEPGESRPYVPGDDVRLIDWNVTARTGEPHVRDPVADHEVDLWLVADVSASQHFGSTVREKREVVVGLAAAFGLPATRLANRVGAVRHDLVVAEVIDPRESQSTDADWVGEALAFFARRTRRRSYRPSSRSKGGTL
jgi:uncharacterized protein (DUF58 family)